MNKIISAIKNEFVLLGKFETIFFFVALILVSVSSILKGDEILAVIASVFGLIYTFSAGKGKIYCYFFGIISTVVCGYIAFRTSLFGTAGLYFLCYLPMEVWGVLEWSKHLIKDTNEIVKTRLEMKKLILLCFFAGLLTVFVWSVFVKIGDLSPIADALCVALSVCAMFLTVKRCIEQWAFWTIVNAVSIYLWFVVYSSGENTFSLFLIRIVYFILGIYFFFKWRKQL